MTIQEVNTRLTSLILSKKPIAPPRQKTKVVKGIRLQLVQKVLNLNRPIQSIYDLSDEQFRDLSLAVQDEQYLSNLLEGIIKDD